jgi:hypothetical protein
MARGKRDDFRSGGEMKRTKPRRIMPSSSSAAFEREARREIEHFLKAIDSYADRFAREPHLSFEQHLYRMAVAGGSGLEEQRRRG